MTRTAKECAPTAGVYVQYGCGTRAPEEWMNFDASARLWLERTPIFGFVVRASVGALFPRNVKFGDIVRGLPLRKNSAAGVYCSHILEHVPRDELPIALRNTFEILAPGGIFRLVLPDLQWRAARYVSAAGRNDPSAADNLLESCYLGYRRGTKTLIEALVGYWRRSEHQWMYDFAGIRAALMEAGFERIRRCEFGDSGNPMFALTENISRFVEADNVELAIEAFKPLDAIA